MKLAADMGLHSGRAAPSLHESPYRQFKKATGRRSTYPLPIPVQTNRATSVNQRAIAPIDHICRNTDVVGAKISPIVVTRLYRSLGGAAVIKGQKMIIYAKNPNIHLGRVDQSTAQKTGQQHNGLESPQNPHHDPPPSGAAP